MTYLFGGDYFYTSHQVQIIEAIVIKRSDVGSCHDGIPRRRHRKPNTECGVKTRAKLRSFAAKLSLPELGYQPNYHVTCTLCGRYPANYYLADHR